MKILDGKKINKNIQASLFKQIRSLQNKPGLKILQIGNDFVSNIYISQKIKFAEKIGVDAEVLKFPKSVSEKTLISKIKKINFDKKVHGIILQLPIPDRLNKNNIIDAIDPNKDVDGLTFTNSAKLFRGEIGGIVPATTRGIFELLDFYKIKIAGKNVVVLGRSNLVGKPTAIQFLNKNATVTICHSQTKNLKEKIRGADIVISAVGKPEFLNKNYFNKKQILICVGVSKNKLGKFVGDINMKGLEVSALTPVIGGVGPMTVACLFQNLFDSYKKQIK